MDKFLNICCRLLQKPPPVIPKPPQSHRPQQPLTPTHTKQPVKKKASNPPQLKPQSKSSPSHANQPLQRQSSNPATIPKPTFVQSQQGMQRQPNPQQFPSTNTVPSSFTMSSPQQLPQNTQLSQNRLLPQTNLQSTVVIDSDEEDDALHPINPSLIQSPMQQVLMSGNNPGNMQVSVD